MSQFSAIMMSSKKEINKTPALKKELEKLSKLVKAHQGKKPSFEKADKDKITNDIIEKMQIE